MHLNDEAALHLWAQDMVRLRRTPAATRTVNECAGLPPLPAVRKTRDRLNDAPVRDGALMSYGPDQSKCSTPPPICLANSRRRERIRQTCCLKPEQIRDGD